MNSNIKCNSCDFLRVVSGDMSVGYRCRHPKIANMQNHDIPSDLDVRLWPGDNNCDGVVCDPARKICESKGDLYVEAGLIKKICNFFGIYT